MPEVYAGEEEIIFCAEVRILWYLPDVILYCNQGFFV